MALNHAGGHHLTNLLLHAAGSIALFWFWWRMTAQLWPSAFVATIFAVHPQHVESVAWISERRDVLSGLFFMLTLGAYLGYVRRGRSLGRYLLVALPFALGLMSKPMLVTLPPLLLLLDYWPLGRLGRAGELPEWTRSIEQPGFGRLVLENSAGGPSRCRLLDDAADALRRQWPLVVGADRQCGHCLRGLRGPMLLAGRPGGLLSDAAGRPACLASDQRFGDSRGDDSGGADLAPPCPYLLVGWFWFLGMLTPTLGLVQIADHARADRYMYLPGIGLYVAVAFVGARLADRWPAARRALLVAVLVVVAILIALAYLQTSYWSDDEALWTHALEVTTESDIADIGLGVALAKQGLDRQAVALYRRALAIHPNSFEGHAQLASALSRLEQVDEALARA